MKNLLLSLLLMLSVNMFANENPRVILETTQGNIELDTLSRYCTSCSRKFYKRI